MLNQIQNIISKIIDLRKGLLVMTVLGMLVSGFVIGGGVRVRAKTDGFYIRCNSLPIGGDCGEEANNQIYLNKDKLAYTYTGCERPKLGFTGTVFFCTGSKQNLANTGVILTKEECALDAGTVSGKCNIGGKELNDCSVPSPDNNKVYCISAGSTTEVTSDQKNLAIKFEGSDVLVLAYNNKNVETTCIIEVTANQGVNGTYIPKSIKACAPGSFDSVSDVNAKKNDSAKANCNVVAAQNKGTISPWNRDGITLNCFKEIINFSDNAKSEVWFSDPTFQVKTPADKIVVIDYKIIDTLCGGDIRIEGSKKCKITKDAFFKEVDKKVISGEILSGEAGTGSTGTSGVGGKTIGGAAGDIAGGIFTLIYQIVAAIIMVLLFIIRYLQMMVLLLFISVMTVLLNLSPNTGFLTTLAVPLWSIFAQIASLGAVGILIFLGSATMIGIEGFEYEKTIAKGAQVAIYVFVSNFTYFGLAFAISLLDGFTKLIVFVFGGGSVFKLFEALISSVSSISKIQNRTGGYALIPDVGNGISATFNVFGKGAGDVTTTLVAEIIVVVGLGLIIWVFGRIFFMLLTRVAILLLLLITSPIWVLGILVKDSLPSGLQGQVGKAVDLVGGTIVFNFAFITTLVLVTIITQKINGGISEFQKSVADAFVPATNTGLAFIDGVSANAQTSGVLSNDAFLGFGAGGFGETISVCAVLGINLAIIYFAFDAIANLIDTNIQAVGKAVGGAVSKNLQNFRKADSFGQGLAMMGQDAFKFGSMAATGGNGLIGDAAGAGLKGVSMGERTVRKTYDGVKDGSLQKGMGRRFGAVGQTVKDLGKLRQGNLSGLNVVGNLQKNLQNTSKGNDARNRAETLDKEIDPLDKEFTNLNNAKNQNDDKLQDNLNQVEASLTGATKARFDQIKAENKADLEKLEQTKESIKQTRVDLAAEMAKEGKDINASSNASDPRVRKLIADEATSKQDVKQLESKVEGNTEGERSFLQNNANSTQAATIKTLRSNSRTMKADIKTKGATLDAKRDERKFARLAEGHERLDVLKQQAKNKKDQIEYKNGGFSGILNNAEVITERLNKASKMDIEAQAEELRKTVSNLKKDGMLTDSQVEQIEANLSKGKSDNEKAIEKILSALKENNKSS